MYLGQQVCTVNPRPRRQAATGPLVLPRDAWPALARPSAAPHPVDAQRLSSAPVITSVRLPDRAHRLCPAHRDGSELEVEARTMSTTKARPSIAAVPLSIGAGLGVTVGVLVAGPAGIAIGAGVGAA